MISVTLINGSQFTIDMVAGEDYFISLLHKTGADMGHGYLLWLGRNLVKFMEYRFRRLYSTSSCCRSNDDSWCRHTLTASTQVVMTCDTPQATIRYHHRWTRANQYEPCLHGTRNGGPQYDR